METPILSDYLNDKNRALYEEVSKEFEILIEFSNEEYYSVYTEGDKAIIYVSKWPCKASFTHELLHIWLLKMGFSITSKLKYDFINDDILATVYPRAMLDYVGNILEHVKFLPIYLKMGFGLKDFLYTFDTPVCTLKEIQWIKTSLEYPILWKTAAEHFIGNFFAVRANVNAKLNYDDCLLFLKATDDDLYCILEQFYVEWEKLDLYTMSSPRFTILYYKLIDDIKEWTLKKSQSIAA
ncbi:MAG TPA: hypothetical protein VK177_17935 [Flavobacteriales bacterium]|nr:hypothetical protein [Flavobacteriales bacterium]